MFVVGFAVIVLALNFASRWTMNFLVGNVPVSWESSLSDSILEDIQPQLKVVENPELLAAVKSASEPLLRRLPSNGYKFEFRLLDDPLPNAFALPGGRIYVNTGLLRTASRPEEIAGVLAHEIAHVTQRHGLRQVISSAGPYYVLRIFISDRRGFLSTISSGSQFLVQQSFSRDFEREADDIGWRYLVAADIDPRGLREFLQRLLSDPILRILDSSSVRVLSSHPPTAERVEHLDSLWQRTKKKSGFIKLPDPGR
jgi:predicted Zn-dependent protease